ncbi:response regulator transcription factor [Dyella sp. EPa41]|uniref:response regulator transcription factor n=1 Tax=Dyella sp. EPa41 TaxID=1561194 RepID=UPI001F166B6A|nr:response regulator transcription factor [Dyella sp. EPa41]
MTLSQEPARPASPLRLVLLEDDDLLRDRVLVPKLSQYGFDVVAIARAAELGEVIKSSAPDIFMLDIGLPDSDGFQVARSLRAELPDAGIVILTGRADNVDRVRGLFEGADAYLAKPVEIDVLVATLYSVARRLRPTQAVSRGKWSLSPDEWFLLSPSGARVMLSKTERRLLEAMMQHANEVMSREALIGALTEDVLAFDPHRLDSLIHRLRRKVLSTLGEPLPLNAVHGAGYVLEV